MRSNLECLRLVQWAEQVGGMRYAAPIPLCPRSYPCPHRPVHPTMRLGIGDHFLFVPRRYADALGDFAASYEKCAGPFRAFPSMPEQAIAQAFRLRGAR
eukprot:gene53887-4279_t